MMRTGEGVRGAAAAEDFGRRRARPGLHLRHRGDVCVHFTTFLSPLVRMLQKRGFGFPNPPLRSSPSTGAQSPPHHQVKFGHYAQGDDKAQVASAIVAYAAMKEDPRAVPRYKERVPYVVRAWVSVGKMATFCRHGID